MTISGAVKLIARQSIDDTTTITATTASSAYFPYLYNNDRNTKMISNLSADGDAEVWTFEFASSATFDRIHVDLHNFKTGTVKYWNGASYVDFSTPIAWVNNTDESNYYEFTEVTADKVQISVTHTTDASEKSCGQFRCFSELGTLSANPVEWAFEFDKNDILHRTSNAGNVLVGGIGSKYIASLLFNDATDADITLLETVKNLGDPVYIFPCGGVTTWTQIGFRIQDIFFVNYTNNFKPQLKENILGIGTVIAVDVKEV